MRFACNIKLRLAGLIKLKLYLLPCFHHIYFSPRPIQGLNWDWHITLYCMVLPKDNELLDSQTCWNRQTWRVCSSWFLHVKSKLRIKFAYLVFIIFGSPLAPSYFLYLWKNFPWCLPFLLMFWCIMSDPR